VSYIKDYIFLVIIRRIEDCLGGERCGFGLLLTSARNDPVKEAGVIETFRVGHVDR
jgi:hypothetical protein